MSLFDCLSKSHVLTYVAITSLRVHYWYNAHLPVIDESRIQVSKAYGAINAFDEEDVKAVKSQYVCQIFLHKAASYFRTLASNGLMTEREANEFLDKYDLELRNLRISAELKTDVRYKSISSCKIAPILEE